MTGSVVFITLLGCAATLSGLLRRLGPAESDQVRIRYQEARKAVVEAALARLDELIESGEVGDRTGRTFHQLYEDLLDRISRMPLQSMASRSCQCRWSKATCRPGKQVAKCTSGTDHSAIHCPDASSAPTRQRLLPD